jgi:hypothetical protein
VGSAIIASYARIPLSGAAGQQGDILAEGLGSKLQAFNRRQIGEDRVGKIVDR